MRDGTITIGGKPYEVNGLSVSQNLEYDLQMEDLTAAKDHSNIVSLRLKRIATALRNGDGFLPDPKNPAGSFKASDMSLESIAAFLNGKSGFAGNMREFYKAEGDVYKLQLSDEQLLKLEQEIEAAKKKNPGEGQAAGSEVGTSAASAA